MGGCCVCCVGVGVWVSQVLVWHAIPSFLPSAVIGTVRDSLPD